ncbi:MAG TPA: glycosyltransferase family 39 protein [Verrucomicrobiae bacterium]|nr:glycosyltransferase family 39 protein [Verrucomicrobiae bacterium]
MKSIAQKWGLPMLTLFTFFILLGTRSLNEPDEGRYSEIAREMIETGNWLVPHLWYLPHLDKPPMTYWLVAASMKVFGQNEWAARLPVALAGISGVWAVFLLGSSLGGRRVGFWSALILQSSLLYFAMSRMLTPDILLTQFVAWAMYFFWRSWQTLNSEFRISNSEFLWWHLAGWIAIALGFLTKGPIALAIPLAAWGALIIFRRREVSGNVLIFGFLAGFMLFLVLAAPWFLAVFQRLPQSAHFMILGQAAGHLLGTTIKNRHGSPFYFLAILAVGLMPWTLLLGWLWRRAHWRKLAIRQKDGWLLLNVWAIFTFALFTFSSSKLPAYILPIFPAMAVVLALRFFSEDRTVMVAPRWVWRLCLAGSLLLPVIFPLLVRFVFENKLPGCLAWQTPVVALAAGLIFWRAREWKPSGCAAGATALALMGLIVTVAEIPMFETGLQANQTLKPMGAALREHYGPGDALVCWGRLPQGLPFYSGSVISATNRPYFGGMDLTQVPFAYPGNRERLGNLLLPDEDALAKMLRGERRVWVVSYGNWMEHLEQEDHLTLRLVARVGRWELFSNQ